MLNLVLSLAGIFVLIGLLGRLLHRYFLYIPDRTRVAPREAGLSGVEEIVFKAADGTKLIAWYLPAKGAKPTLLYFTGNSGNTANRAGKIRTIAASGYGVFMLNYRRYGGSEGRPSEVRNASDAVSAYDCLRAQGVAPSDIVAYGESLGKLLWKGLPLGLIMVDQYRTIDRIGEVTVPLFIIHGGRDTIIPLDQARRVHHAANEPKRLVVVPQAGHNDLYDRGAFEKVHGFLESLRPAKVAKAGRQVEVAAAASGEVR
jgi:fermentation-respiration switch protein FrsA (DUF1100 family)